MKSGFRPKINIWAFYIFPIDQTVRKLYFLYFYPELNKVQVMTWQANFTLETSNFDFDTLPLHLQSLSIFWEISC